jgi:hypothetical protein
MNDGRSACLGLSLGLGLALAAPSAVAAPKVNQVGYLPADDKGFPVTAGASAHAGDAFSVLDAATHETVATGADPLLQAVIAQGTPPAKCYVDECTAVGSYASNEARPATAPLWLLAGALASVLLATRRKGRG